MQPSIGTINQRHETTIMPSETYFHDIKITIKYIIINILYFFVSLILGKLVLSTSVGNFNIHFMSDFIRKLPGPSNSVRWLAANGIDEKINNTLNTYAVLILLYIVISALTINYMLKLSSIKTLFEGVSLKLLIGFIILSLFPIYILIFTPDNPTIYGFSVSNLASQDFMSGQLSFFISPPLCNILLILFHRILIEKKRYEMQVRASSRGKC